MSKALNLKLSDAAYAQLRRKAEADGMSPERLAASALERSFGGAPAQSACQAARQRFESHFGELDLGAATGTDNEIIDADLAREYASPHEEI